MDKNLEDLSNIWKGMPRNNVYEIEVADKFYDECLMDIVADKFIKNYASGNICDLLFVTVGTSWQPVALSILAHKPKVVIFIHTEEVVKEANKALTYVNSRGFVCDVDYLLVDKAVTEKMVKNIAQILSNRTSEGLCIDITAGTKAMSACGAMLATHFNMELSYIESNYLPVFRHPEPGSERLVVLKKPKDILRIE